MRRTIGSVLVLCLGLALVLVVQRVNRVGRGDRRDPASVLGSAATDSTQRTETEVVEPGPVRSAAEQRDAVEPQVEAEDGAAALHGMRVLVRDAVDERPIANALVTLYDRATPVPARTGRDGVGLVPVLSFVEPALLRVSAAGHFHWSKQVEPTPSLAVALPRATLLSGRVLAADTGAPIAGAELALLHGACSGCEPERFNSGADGRYELPAVPLRTATVLEVRAEGFAAARRAFELGSDEPRVTEDIRLVRGLELFGRVEDWTSGRGVAGAQVGELVADAEGKFQGRILARPVTGKTSFDVRAPGYATLRVALTGPHEEELVLRLPLLVRIEGRVTDPTPSPLADALVTFAAKGPVLAGETSPLYQLPAGWSYSTEETTAKSDDEGMYGLAVLPWSLNCIVRAQKRGFLFDEASFRSIGEPGTKTKLDWWLKPGIEPTVVHGTVTVNGRARGSFQGTVHWRGPTRSGSGPLQRGNYYRFEVEPGEVRLSAALDLVPRAEPSEFVAVLAQGSMREIDLDVAAPTATITGSVRFADKTGVPGRFVLASCTLPADVPPPPVLYDNAMTDEHGEFELHVDDLGLEFDVTTQDFDGNTLTLGEVAAGASGVDFELERGHRVFLRAREARTGAALTMDEEVQFLARGDPRYGFWRLEPVSTAPDVDGWYECGSTARELDLLAVPRAGELPLYGIHLVPHVKLDGPTPARVEFTLERGLDVSLELAKGVAPWPAEHDLLLVDEELWRAMYRPRGRRYPAPLDELQAQCTVHFDEQGHALLRGLAPGSYRFLSLPNDLVVDPEFLRVDPGTLSVPVRWSVR